MSEQLLPELETMNFLAAKAAVRALPDDADFASLKARELARAKGPRPDVITAIDARLGARGAPLGVRAEGAPVGPADGTAGSPPPSAHQALPDLPIRELDWRGIATLYICTICKDHKTFDSSVAYAHALTHLQQKE